MNTIATALERAVKTAGNRAELSDAFDREWHKVEFSPNAQSVVCSVPEDAARQWVRGQFSDLDLILSMNGDTSAIWWAGLPNLREFASGVRAVRRLHAEGAAVMVLQTFNPIIIQRATRFDFSLYEYAYGLHRIIADSISLANWLGRFHHQPTP